VADKQWLPHVQRNIDDVDSCIVQHHDERAIDIAGADAQRCALQSSPTPP
jgi:hypothetical protein